MDHSDKNKLTTDICIVGSGISSTYTLINLIELSDREAWYGKITVIEKTDEFYRGVPYGKRSGTGTLCITSLKDFLPEDELSLFLEWMSNQSLHDLVSDNEANTQLYRIWMDRNRDQVEKLELNDLYIPRTWFGKFLDFRVESALIVAKEKRLIIELMEADAFDIREVDDGTSIEIGCINENDGTITCYAKKVVLATGATPRKKLHIMSEIEIVDSNQKIPKVVDFYLSSFDAALQELVKEFTCSDKGLNVCLVGSNASASEILYVLNTLQSENKLHSVYVISTSGILPLRVFDDVGTTFIPENLIKAEKDEVSNAKELFDAILADIDLGNRQNRDLSSTVQVINGLAMKLLRQMDESEQRNYVYFYGNRVGQYQRRIGFEYFGSIVELENSGLLTVISGTVEKIGDGNRVVYRDTKTDELKDISDKIDIIVNCVGPETVDAGSSSPLIRSILTNDIAKASPSKIGFVVDDSLKSHKSVYVLGPLIAGNIIAGEWVWHAEHCGKLQRFAKKVAEDLYVDIG